ncbi:MAG: hypothetical protein E6Q40_07615 [Cupriavidus sp.]|nr:MAG: hypothetical protein E6Q40_07615 [Cupriavidus sp.]
MAIADTTHRAFDERLVLPGDIVLTTTTAAISTAIRTVIRADISHAMICVEHASVIDSTGEGVHGRNLARIVLEPGCAGYVLRPRKPLTEQQLQAVVRYAREQVGTRYSVFQAGKSIVGGRHPGLKQFCSRLVAQAYHCAGVALSENPDFCHPGELLSSSLLEEVHGVLIPLTPEEAAFRTDGDGVQPMRDVTNALLERVRVIAPKVESINDIIPHLLEHPEVDDEFVEALQASGYLVAWRWSVEATPWQYDVSRLEAQPRSVEDKKAYCIALLDGERWQPHRFVTNRGGYLELSVRAPRRYFEMMADLHTLLATLHAQRVKTAREWLKGQGFTIPDAPPPPRPHTTEWFALLQHWDPPKAAKTQYVIERADSIDVCSVCGDDPASDFELRDAPPAGPSTIRLCDDCYRIRSADEPMRPFVSSPTLVG